MWCGLLSSRNEGVAVTVLITGVCELQMLAEQMDSAAVLQWSVVNPSCSTFLVNVRVRAVTATCSLGLKDFFLIPDARLAKTIVC